MPVAAPRRRADGDEDRIGAGDRRGEVGGEIEPPGLDVGRHQIIEAGLEDRDFAAAQRRDLVGVLVDARDLVTEIGEAGAGDQPYIARANHGNPHETTCLCWLTGTTEFGRVLKHFCPEGKSEGSGTVHVNGMSFV